MINIKLLNQTNHAFEYLVMISRDEGKQYFLNSISTYTNFIIGVQYMSFGTKLSYFLMS